MYKFWFRAKGSILQHEVRSNQIIANINFIQPTLSLYVIQSFRVKKPHKVPLNVPTVFALNKAKHMNKRCENRSPDQLSRAKVSETLKT